MFEINYHVGKLLKILSYCNFFIPNFVSISGAHQIKTRITHLYEAGQGKIHKILNPTDCKESYNKLYKYVYDSHVMTRSFEDYLNWVKPSKKKLLLAWTCDLILWITFALIVLAFFYTRSHQPFEYQFIFIILGIPIAFFPNIHVVFMTLGFGLLLGAYSRFITIIIDGRNQSELVDLMAKIGDPAIRGNLRSTYYSKICLIIEMLLHLKSVFEMTPILIFLVLIWLTVYSYRTPGVTFSYTMILGCFFWTLIAWLMLTVFFSGFLTYFIVLFYIQYRFKQINEIILKCESISDLMSSIREHHEICSINERSNRLLNLILFELYYVASGVADLFIIQIIYLDTLLNIKIFFYCGIVMLFPMIYSLAYLSGRLSKEAHTPYKLLNSIIAKESIPMSKLKNIDKWSKFQIINMIERLAQTEIAVPCLDLFSLNNYEFYLFISACFKNFFLFVDLISR